MSDRPQGANGRARSDRRIRQLTDLTWPEVDAAAQRGAAVIVPVGATEQHGHHLPLCTDAALAEHLR